MKMTVTTEYTPRANPSRGYHDWVMRIVFEAHKNSWLVEDAQKSYAVMLHDKLMKQQYMWCRPPVKVSETKEGSVWEISYGYDSGD